MRFCLSTCLESLHKRAISVLQKQETVLHVSQKGLVNGCTTKEQDMLYFKQYNPSNKNGSMQMFRTAIGPPKKTTTNFFPDACQRTAVFPPSSSSGNLSPTGKNIALTRKTRNPGRTLYAAWNTQVNLVCNMRIFFPH